MPKKSMIDLAAFHAKVKEGRRPRAAVRLVAVGDPSIVGDERVASFVFSDNSVDRYGDTIDARGWVLTAFNANPVALFGHDANSVENVIGKARNVRVDGSRLVGEIEFAEASVNPNAETVFQMVKAGYLNTVSVGFQPLDWSLTKDKSRPGGIDFKKQELLEISIVPVPANPNAIALARAAGIDVDRLRLIVDRGSLKISKKGLYAVSSLARLLAELGWLEDDVAWESEYEGDGSAVPQMLADALKQLGAALIAMTVEEVRELLAEENGSDPVLLIDDPMLLEGLTPGQVALRALVSATKGRPALVAGAGLSADEIAALRTLVAPAIKAGKVLSAANEKTIREAHEMIVKGCTMLNDMVEASSASDIQTEAHARRVREAEAERILAES